MRYEKLREHVRTILGDLGVFHDIRDLRGNLDSRVKRLEQFHCDHAFCDRQKGCTASIFCSKCGALNPKWEIVPRDAMELTYEGQTSLGYGRYVPRPKDGTICVKGIWYWPSAQEVGGA